MRYLRETAAVVELGEDNLMLAGEIAALVAEHREVLAEERKQLRAAEHDVEEAEHALTQARRRLARQEGICARAETAFEDTKKLAEAAAVKARRDLAAVGFAHVDPGEGV